MSDKTLISPSALEAGLMTRSLEYRDGHTALEGYLAWDEALQGDRPGVLVVHEWNGINEYIRRRTEQLAKLGYVAFAADIYGKGVRPGSAEEAAAEAGRFRGPDRSLMRRRARLGLETLRNCEHVDEARLAAMGYCFGAQTALELARSGADLLGVVSFHGNLDTPEPGDARNIKGRVLALHGGADPFAPMEQVRRFVEEMEAAKVDYQLVLYGGARHSFTNPAQTGQLKGALYDARADARSWEQMRLFFVELFERS